MTETATPPIVASTEIIPRNNCILCERWERTPFFKRHTTPTTAQDTETALVLGYWVASRKLENVAVRLCERHSICLFQLDTIENANAARAAALASEQSPAQESQRLEFERRASEITAHLSAPRPQPAALVPSAAVLGTTPGAVTEAGSAASKAVFPCPLCGKVVTSGEVHTC